MRTSALRAFTASVVTTASFVVAAGVGAAPSYAAVAPRAPVVMPAAIESMPAYQPQTFCDPVDKPGPVAFGALLTTTYPDTHVVSISRGCASESGTSEHKDGRALDWGADSRNPQQAKEAQAVFTWLFAKDAQGDPNAMLRRLGIMYVIYDKKIWGAWSQSWQPYACSGVTACHQDHVHFSFDWAGATKKTSFWTGTVGSPVPVPAYVYTSKAFAQVVSVSSRASTVTTPFQLKAGVSYLLTVSGTYHYAAATGAVADGECDSRNGTTWRSTAPGDTSASSGVLDLWAGGHRSWHPVRATGGGCNTATHTYTQQLAFPTTGPLKLAVDDPNRTDNHGTLKVTIQRV